MFADLDLRISLMYASWQRLSMRARLLKQLRISQTTLLYLTIRKLPSADLTP